jgi:hypothetical protein
MAAKDNHPNNVSLHPFQMEDATNAEHLPQEIVGLHKGVNVFA